MSSVFRAKCRELARVNRKAHLKAKSFQKPPLTIVWNRELFNHIRLSSTSLSGSSNAGIELLDAAISTIKSRINYEVAVREAGWGHNHDGMDKIKASARSVGLELPKQFNHVSHDDGNGNDNDNDNGQDNDNDNQIEIEVQETKTK